MSQPKSTHVYILGYSDLGYSDGVVKVGRTANYGQRFGTLAPVVVASSYGTVREILASRPGRWMTVHEVLALIPTAFRNQLTVSVIRSEFGALHDHGQATCAGDKARWDL